MPTNFESLVDESGLPLNRTESFYTGTVLPGIVCADEMYGVPRLRDLINRVAQSQGLAEACPDLHVTTGTDGSNVQIYSEFNFKLAAMGAPDRFPADALPDRDTPDFVIFCRDPEPTLIAIEAKMFLLTPPNQLKKQIEGQRAVLEALTKIDSVGLTPQRIVQVGLVPRGLYGHRNYHEAGLGFPVLQWEEIHREFPATGSAAYWANILLMAVRRWEDLVNTPTAQVSGKRIFKSFEEGTCEYLWLGRRGGLKGKDLTDDFKPSGNWKSHLYAVSAGKPNDKNWFSVEDFVAKAKEWHATKAQIEEGH